MLDSVQVDEIVDPRIRARRDEVARARQRRRRRWQLAIFATLAAAVAGWSLTRTALLDVDRIVVRGSPHTSDEEVLAAAGVAAGDQLVDVDTGKAREGVLSLPWVQDATVDVSWRGDVTIDVREREPLAMVTDGEGRPVLVDREGRVLAPATMPDATLVVIDGVVAGAPGEVLPEPAADALGVAEALTPGVRSRVETLVVHPDRQIELRVRPSGAVRFCTADEVEAKVRALRTVFAQVDDARLWTIDVCVPDQPVVTRVP